MTLLLLKLKLEIIDQKVYSITCGTQTGGQGGLLAMVACEGGDDGDCERIVVARPWVGSGGTEEDMHLAKIPSQTAPEAVEILL